MRPAPVAGFLIAVFLVAGALAFPEGSRPLSQPLSVDLIDVPLARVLEVLAAHLGVSVRPTELAQPPTRVTLQLKGASAEVVLVLLAWESDSDWLLAGGVLHWGPTGSLPADQLERGRRQRAARLGRLGALLGRRLDQPVPFRLKAQGVKLAELLRFLERELSVPFLLDARCAEHLDRVVEGEFEGLSVAELLHRLLAPRRAPVALAWTVVGEVVVVSTPERLRPLRALVR